MGGSLNPKIVGASVIGFALVAGAYVLSNFGESKISPILAVANSETAPARVALAVVDTDNNGLEDWRDEFVNVEIETPAQLSATYTVPTTLTGQTGISLIEGMIRSKMYGPLTSGTDVIVESAVDTAVKRVQTELYTIDDVDVLQDWVEEDIRHYANTMAAIMYLNSDSTLGNQLELLDEIVKEGNTDKVQDLVKLSEVYSSYRDDSLLVPVPEIFVKQHLDLINSYHLVHEDIKAMSDVNKDPLLALMHIKRHQSSASALRLSLENVYLSLEPHASVFEADDQSAVFVLFSPDFNHSY